MPSKPADPTTARNRATKKLAGKDKLGLGAQVIATVGGAGAGASTAGAAASAAGATTLLGSTKLAALLGGVFVTSIPVGWVVGMAAAGGLAGYGIARLARSGGYQDRVRRQLARKLASGARGSIGENDVQRLSTILGDKVSTGAITLDKAGQVVKLVTSGKLDPAVAIERLEALPPATPIGPA